MKFFENNGHGFFPQIHHKHIYVPQKKTGQTELVLFLFLVEVLFKIPGLAASCCHSYYSKILGKPASCCQSHYSRARCIKDLACIQSIRYFESSLFATYFDTQICMKLTHKYSLSLNGQKLLEFVQTKVRWILQQFYVHNTPFSDARNPWPMQLQDKSLNSFFRIFRLKNKLLLFCQKRK